MEIFSKTDIGLKRDSNQDTVYVNKLNEQVGFAIVCDGMGGQNGGNVASEMACRIIKNRLEDELLAAADNEIKALIIGSLSEANIEIYKASNLQPGYKGMGTTVVMAVVLNKIAYIGHIGDSRVYLLREDRLHQLTRDHSVVQELLEQGKISQEEAKVHPNKNMITRAVGVNLTVDIDYLEVQLSDKSKLSSKQLPKLLLCSDGLTNMVSDEIIEKTLRKYGAQETCEKLVELSLKAGGVDNITVAVID